MESLNEFMHNTVGTGLVVFRIASFVAIAWFILYWMPKAWLSPKKLKNR